MVQGCGGHLPAAGSAAKPPSPAQASSSASSAVPAMRPPRGWAATSLDAFSHEHCGSLPPYLDPARGPVRLAPPPPPVEAGVWEI
jgi:hypothetical protein